MTGRSEAGDAYLPGYTHLQRAQPVLLAHHLLAHGWALGRDVDRLPTPAAASTCHRSGPGPWPAPRCPSTRPALPPTWVSPRVFDNSLDAVSDRDFVAEALFALALFGVHLSRLGEEVVLWSTDEFGFLGLDDAYSTGSSMLPQKKNPDIAELARGKTGRLIGNLTGLLATLKGLPLAYNRDLQEDKEPLFDSVDTVVLALAAMTGLLASSELRLEAMAAAADAPTRRPPTWPSTWWPGACPSATPTPSWARWCVARSTKASPSASWWRPPPSWAPTPSSCSTPGWRRRVAPLRGERAPDRWPPSWRPSPRSWRRRGPICPRGSVDRRRRGAPWPGPPTVLLRPRLS